ncbi:MAG TPA: YceI family protein [Blattabacteriaceae bacterium]|nr:YceI family protein [Blattabacteriaceae bacterium]
MKTSFMSHLLRQFVLAASVACLLVSSAIAAEKFSVDADHSKVGFSVTLIGVTEVEGRFSDFSGTIMYEEADLTKSSVTAIIKSASINTGSSFRDKDLKAAPFFDADKFPTIRFQSTAIRKQGHDYIMAGLLTIKDVSKEIQAPLVWRQHKMNDPWKNSRIAFDSRLKLNRKASALPAPNFGMKALRTPLISTCALPPKFLTLICGDFLLQRARNRLAHWFMKLHKRKARTLL